MMISSQPEYKPGDPVWVKLDRCPWWPSLVIPTEECPVPARPNVSIIACIHFVPEEEYDIVYSRSKILPWTKEKRVELVSKGLLSLKNKEQLKAKFRSALDSLAERCAIEIPKVSEAKLKRKPVFWHSLDESSKKCVESGIHKPKAGSSLSESTDHNHRQQDETTETFDSGGNESPGGAFLSESDQKKRFLDGNIQNTAERPLKKAKVSPRKKLSKDLDKIIIQDKSRCEWDPNVEVDECDADEEGLVPMPLSQPSQNKSDQEDPVDSASDSDDEDLPDVLSSCTKESVKEGTILWVKCGRWPFWPAIVKNCYRRKKALQKVSVVFIGETPTDTPGPSRTCLRYNKKNMMAFADQEGHRQIKDEGLKSAYGTVFHEAVSRAEDFLIKKGLGEASSPFVFFADDITKAIGCSDPSVQDVSDYEEEVCTQSNEQTGDEKEESSCESLTDLDDFDSDSSTSSNMQGESHKLKRKKQKRRDRAARIIELTKTPKFKNYLIDIYRGKQKCERHTKFMSASSHKERSSMRHHGFGPIDDDEQHMALVSILSGYFQEVSGRKFPDTAYIFDVWVPETIILAMTKVMKKTREVVEDSFFRGPIRTKEEQKIQREEMKETSKNIDPEDIEKYRAKVDQVKADLVNGMRKGIST